MAIQHMGGTITLLQNKTHNANHRKFSVIVSNMGRMVSIGGMLYGGVQQQYIVGSCVLALILLVASVYSVFFKKPPSV